VPGSQGTWESRLPSVLSTGKRQYLTHWKSKKVLKSHESPVFQVPGSRDSPLSYVPTGESFFVSLNLQVHATAYKAGLRIRIRSDPNLLVGSGSGSFPPDQDLDPGSGSFPSYIKLYNTIICKLSFFKNFNFMTGEHFKTTKVSKCEHPRWHFLIFFCHKPCKTCAGQEKCAFFKAWSRSGIWL